MSPDPVVLASVADTFRNTVTDGSLVLAIPVAFAAGLFSFLSPCVLPLVPGYLSYVTGLSGADLLEPETRPVGPGAISDVAPTQAEEQWSPRARHAAGTLAPPASSRGPATATPPVQVHRGRVLLGSVLFVCGFSAVFVSLGALFGDLGTRLLIHSEDLSRILGVIVVLLGFAFLGWIPGLQREYRSHRLPVTGLAGAFPLGFIFGLGWTPCIGPTLGAVQTLALTGGTSSRGALLSFVYCLGLGLPFIIAGLAFRRALGAFAFLRRHTVLITRIGGVMLITLGVLLMTGVWNDVTLWLKVHLTASYTPAV